ncbi:MAG TPA: RNA polymerase sigma factor [Mariniphaga sp.]|nr:RNA polymerase sigma factor [Mariniphaga sp.]
MTVEDYNNAVRNYADGLYRYVLKSIKYIHLAEDIVQDSYEKLWKNYKNVEALKVKAYLYTTAYHTLIDYIRKEKKTMYSDKYELHAEGVEEKPSDLKEILNEAVNRLPEIQRMVLLLRDYEGYSYQEIGEITNLNESQVKVYIYRARLFLKKYIGKPEVVI